MKHRKALLLAALLMLAPGFAHGVERTADSRDLTNKVRINTLQMQLSMQTSLIAYLVKQINLSQQKVEELCKKTPNCTVTFR